MAVILFHPEVAAVSCKQCQRFLYNVDWTPTMRGDTHQPRLPGQPTPCHLCPKIPASLPKGPEYAAELSDRNWMAYQHYLRCEAVGRFPEDPIVERNAAAFRSVFRQYDRQPMNRLIALLMLARTAPQEQSRSWRNGRFNLHSD